MKFFASLFFIFNMFFAFAAQRQCNEFLYPEIDPSISPAYNYKAKIFNNNCWEYSIGASFLYWQPLEQGNDLGVYANTTLVSNNPPFNDQHAIQDHHNIDLDTSYHPAFKMHLGATENTDNWNLNLVYTWFHSKDSKSKDIPQDDNIFFFTSLFPQSLDPGTNSYKIHHAKGVWEIDLNLLNLEIGRSFFVGKKLIFQPYVGPELAWLDQKYRFNSTYKMPGAPQIDLFSQTNNKSDSWLLGPRIGINTHWVIKKGFNFIAKGAYSVFYQQINTSIKEDFDVIFPPGDLIYRDAKLTGNKKDHFINSHVECSLGFDYGCFFCRNTKHFNISAEYQFQIYTDQNTIRALSDEFVNVYDNIIRLIDYKSLEKGTINNLMLHGLDLTAMFSF